MIGKVLHDDALELTLTVAGVRDGARGLLYILKGDDGEMYVVHDHDVGEDENGHLIICGRMWPAT